MADSLEIVDSEGETLVFSADILRRLPAFALVELPDRCRAARLAALVPDDVRAEGATLRVCSPAGAVAVPLAAAIDAALIVFESSGRALSREIGGPFRFVIPEATTPEARKCADVRGVTRLEIGAK